MKNFGRMVWAVMIGIMTLTVAGCDASVNADDPVPTNITVGSDKSAQGDILANIYADAVRATGVTVGVDSGLGDRPAVIAALDAGTVALVPEFTDGLLQYFDRGSSVDETDEQARADDVFAQLNKSLPEGLAVSDYATATGATPEDGYVVPLFRKGTLGDASIKSLDVVAGELTTADLADMTERVRGGEKSSDVAADWSSNHGL